MLYLLVAVFLSIFPAQAFAEDTYRISDGLHGPRHVEIVTKALCISRIEIFLKENCRGARKNSCLQNIVKSWHSKFNHRLPGEDKINSAVRINALHTKESRDLYSLRRLLSRYLNHATSRKITVRANRCSVNYSQISHPDTFSEHSLKDFCAENENTQLRDKAFSEAGFYVPGFSTAFDNADEIWEDVWKYGLSESDIGAIYHYGAVAGSDVINSSLRKGEELSEKNKLWVETFSSALAKLPSGESVLARKTTLPRETLAQYQKGAIVSDEGFLSTTRDLSWLSPKNQRFPGEHIFLIYGRNGKSIKKYVMFKSEEEILFPAGTRFKVLERNPQPDGKIYFILAEVDENGQMISKIPDKLPSLQNFAR